ncbi:MAG: hypothetical protein C0433_20105 [Cyclobacterium sp.]|nr:hypothetical protein [Cyclobacterium sp.]
MNGFNLVSVGNMNSVKLMVVKKLNPLMSAVGTLQLYLLPNFPLLIFQYSNIPTLRLRSE